VEEKTPEKAKQSEKISYPYHIFGKPSRKEIQKMKEKQQAKVQ